VIVRTFEGLQALSGPSTPWGAYVGGSVSLYTACPQTYAAIYRTQPAVRRMVDFLARNVANVPLPVYRRVSATDRERLPRHELAGILSEPNPATTQYRLIEALMGDLGVYFDAFWLKVRTTPFGLLRLPPDAIEILGGILPSDYVWTHPNGERTHHAPSEIVRFSGYNPTNLLTGLSPLETLRRILAEEHAAGEHREGFWRNAARIDGVVTRPKEMKRYTPAQAKDWREQWQTAYAGGQGAGKTVLLQDGETFTPQSFSAKDSEFTATRKLNTEEVAAAYHIPQPMVGLLDRATFSNVTELHQMLYTDCLGPWLVMIEQEIQRQLLPECRVTANIYVEFNIDAKLRGSFEQQTTALQVSVGKPWRTVNEARALQNLPSTGDPTDDRVAPQQGGPADATAQPSGPAAVPPDRAAAETIVRQFWARQSARILKQPVDERATFFDADRWDAELSDDLGGQVARAHAINLETVALLEAGQPAFASNRVVLAEVAHG